MSSGVRGRTLVHLAEYSPHPPGQFTRQLITLAQSAHARGWTTWLGLPTSDQPRAWHHELRDAGWKLTLLKRPWGPRRAYLGDLRDLLRAARPDVVHLHFHAASMFALRALAPNALRVMQWHNPPSVSRAALFAMNAICAPKQIAVSEGLGAGIVAACRPLHAELVSIGNCVDLPASVVDCEGEDLLAIQAIRPQKDAATLLASIHMLVDLGWSGRLRWIGGGDVDGAKEVARRFGLADRVDFLGFIDDPGPYIDRCALLVLASHFEGQPYALLEATAHRRAFVATDLPGCREIAGPHADTLLAPREDPGAMASRIWRLLQDLPARRAIAASLHEETRRERTTNSWATRVLDLYDLWLD